MRSPGLPDRIRIVTVTVRKYAGTQLQDKLDWPRQKIGLEIFAPVNTLSQSFPAAQQWL